MEKKEPRVITQNDYYALLGLRELARRSIEQLEHLEAAAMDITKETEKSGWTGEFIWGSREIDECLKFLNITVETSGGVPLK